MPPLPLFGNTHDQNMGEADSQSSASLSSFDLPRTKQRSQQHSRKGTSTPASTISVQQSSYLRRNPWVCAALIVVATAQCLFWRDEVLELMGMTQQANVPVNESSNNQLLQHYSELYQDDPDSAVAKLEEYMDSNNWKDHLSKINAIATAVSNAEGYPWNDIDFSKGKPSGKGRYKSFWDSRSNSSYGYLLTRWKADGIHDPFSAGLGYEREQFLLSQNYTIPPLALERPYPLPLANFSDYMMDVLNLYGHRNKISSQKGDALYIQKTNKVPTPHLFVAETRYKSKKTKKAIPDFSRLLREQQNTTSLAEFRSTFQSEADQFYEIVTTAGQDWLLYDFQYALTPKGHWYYLDFDRKDEDFEAPYKRDKILKNFKKRTERLLYWLTEADDFSQLKQENFCISGFRC